jgi:serine/threonine-protein kinase
LDLNRLGLVGRYQILEEIGRGAHGVVYKALDPAIGRTIAIKAIPLGNIDTADRELVREGILREARLAGTLSHPNIVTVYDVVDGENEAFIIMEYVDGESMEMAISAAREKRPNALTRTAFLTALRQVAQALDYAHRKGVIHRDIKPANIVLTDHRAGQTAEMVAKIADFGVAKFSAHDKTQQVGGASALVGTPNYMSPEQVAGARLTGATDQFSLAVIAYEVLTGQKAFTADSLETLLYRIRNEAEEPVDKLNPELSPTVSKVMQRAMTKNPDDRFTTCGEFAGTLEFALGDAPPQIQEDFDAEEPAGSWGKKIALILALCVAAILALMMMVRMNSGPAIPTQVLDTKNAPVSPPPIVDELKPERTAPPLDLNQKDLNQKESTPARASDNSPTIVKVPSPTPQLQKKKVVPIRQPKPVVAATGEVQLLTDPPGANVVIDGNQPCVTPCSITLPAGRHTLAATMAGFGTARKIFYVPQDLSIILPMVKSMGVLLVSSEPSGATVNVDSQSAGRTPLTLRLPPGTHRVSVWDGTRWHDETVLVTTDEVHTSIFRF